MPELPEVETVRRGLAPVMEGRTIVSVVLNRPDLRFPLPSRFAERVGGTRITRLSRRAKFLVAELSSGDALIMHLGMSGRFTITDGTRPGDFHHEIPPDPKHDHIIFHIEGGQVVTYNDPRRFGFMELWPLQQMEQYPRLAGYGPEPLSNEFSHAWLNEALKDKKAPIKAALLDQRMIAGLGNIYVCEALFRARISPLTPAGKVSKPRLETLAARVRDVLGDAIAAGGSTLRDFANAEGGQG